MTQLTEAPKAVRCRNAHDRLFRDCEQTFVPRPEEFRGGKQPAKCPTCRSRPAFFDRTLDCMNAWQYGNEKCQKKFLDTAGAQQRRAAQGLSAPVRCPSCCGQKS